MSNLRVQYVLPDVAADQRPLVEARVEMRSDPSFDFAEVATVTADLSKVVLTDLADGTYEVRVRAFDGTEFGSYSDPASITLVTVPPPVRAPGQVTGVTLTQE